MAVLGLILLLAAGGLTLDVVIQNTSSINVNALGQTFTLSPGWLFIAGLVAGAVGLLAVTMIVGGLGRSHRRRVVLAEARGSIQDLQAERDQLAGDLYHERSARTSTPEGRVDGQEAAPATVDPVIALPAATVAMTQSDGRVARSVHRRGILHRRHHDDAGAAAAAATTDKAFKQ
jgi:hypothetical protein